MPGEHEKAMIFILANHVMAYANLKEQKKKEVLELAATVVLYNHGYSKIYPVNALTWTWSKRLDAALFSGTSVHPLRALQKGRMPYTDKLEEAEPGYALFLY